MKTERCVHCGGAHEPGASICPTTGLPLLVASPDARRVPPELRATLPQPVRRSRASRSQSARELVGCVIGGKYRMIGLIGEGGMGAVYEAEHLAIGRRVAVKVLHPHNAQKPEAVSRLHHEARVVGTIGHPNICEVYDMGRLDDGSPYLVMERLHGETLADRIRRETAIAYPDVIEIVVQVLSALVIAHGKGVIHRDLKPDNIFLSQRPGMPPVAKLLDFGISKASGIEDTAVNLTKSGMVMGTPYYMAPEQARGERTLDHRVDLWAVGVILYETLTGRRPFVAKNYNALLVQILTARHRPITDWKSDVPAPLVYIVDKALSKMREDRFQSAAEFQDALLRFKQAYAPSHGSLLGQQVDETIVLSPHGSAARYSSQDETPALPPIAPEEPADPEQTIVDPPRFFEESTEGGEPTLRPGALRWPKKR